MYLAWQEARLGFSGSEAWPLLEHTTQAARRRGPDPWPSLLSFPRPLAGFYKGNGTARTCTQCAHGMLVLLCHNAGLKSQFRTSVAPLSSGDVNCPFPPPILEYHSGLK